MVLATKHGLVPPSDVHTILPALLREAKVLKMGCVKLKHAASARYVDRVFRMDRFCSEGESWGERDFLDLCEQARTGMLRGQAGLRQLALDENEGGFGVLLVVVQLDNLKTPEMEATSALPDQVLLRTYMEPDPSWKIFQFVVCLYPYDEDALGPVRVVTDAADNLPGVRLDYRAPARKIPQSQLIALPLLGSMNCKLACIDKRSFLPTELPEPYKQQIHMLERLES